MQVLVTVEGCGCVVFPSTETGYSRAAAHNAPGKVAWHAKRALNRRISCNAECLFVWDPVA